MSHHHHHHEHASDANKNLGVAFWLNAVFVVIEECVDAVIDIRHFFFRKGREASHQYIQIHSAPGHPFNCTPVLFFHDPSPID